MKIEKVYDTSLRSSRRHNSSYIRVLENEPNFIQKFELFYRSSNTDGQWVKYGVFDGNSSIFDSTKIKFDEIIAKEIRIIPLAHTGSFEKVKVTVLTYLEKFVNKSEDDTVVYTIHLPHNKFRHDYSQEMDSISSVFRNGCGCHRCEGIIKGHMKSRHREFIDQCSDI
jgi:hypothetical protein